MLQKLKLFVKIFLGISLMSLFALIYAYAQSTESDFFRFVGMTYYEHKYPNQIDILTEPNITINDIQIRQLTPQNDTLIVYQNGEETGLFLEIKDLNIFLVLYKNELLGSWIHFKGKAEHRFAYFLEFFRDENEQILFTYSIRRQPEFGTKADTK